VGYGIPWYCEVEELNFHEDQLQNLYPEDLYYNKHKKRAPNDHVAVPLMLPDGITKVVPKLHFGTQINEYRQARNRV
jgi:hypothetical protein